MTGEAEDKPSPLVLRLYFAAHPEVDAHRWHEPLQRISSQLGASAAVAQAITCCAGSRGHCVASKKVMAVPSAAHRWRHECSHLG